MRTWAFLLGGLIVWTVHFFTLYAIASIFLTTTLARLLAAGVTLACLGVAGWLLISAARSLRGRLDPFERWTRRLAALIAAMSLIAVLWQGFPVVLA